MVWFSFCQFSNPENPDSDTDNLHPLAPRIRKYSKIPLNLYYSLWSAIRIIAPGGA